MKIRIFFAVFLLGISTLPAIDNVILNGDFQTVSGCFPRYWMMRSHSAGYAEAIPAGGAEKYSFLRIVGRKGKYSVDQIGFHLAAGEKYRISAMIRTEALTDPEAGIWLQLCEPGCLYHLPSDQREWKYVEREFTAPEVKNGLFHLEISSGNQGGTLDVTNVRIEPLTEKGKQESRTQTEAMDRELVPLARMNHLSAAHPQIPFMLLGFSGDEPAALEAEFTLSGFQIPAIRLPLAARRVTFNFAKWQLKPGEYTLNASIRNRADGKEMLKHQWQIRLLDAPDLPASSKKLNNFVTLLYQGKLASGADLKIANPRTGWVLFQFKRVDGKAPQLTLNGKTLIAPNVTLSSVIRRLDAGSYTLHNGGSDAEIDLRLIPDIQIFPLGNCPAPGNDPVNWRFAKKFAIPALTTINCSGFSPAERQEIRDSGLIYLSNFQAFMPDKPADEEDLVTRLNASTEMSGTDFDGTTMDEVEYWHVPDLKAYARAMKRCTKYPEKNIYSYVIGPPTLSFANYISSAINVSRGHGRILFEVYNRSQFTEEDAVNYYRQISQHLSFYRDIDPGLLTSLTVMLGNFSLPPMHSLDHLPGVDFRYALDMQMHLLATDPNADGLGGIGFWGAHSCDEEMLRWCFALLKHYAVEGHTDMLSSHHGFTYRNELIRNGDFEEKLDGWTTKGTVEVQEMKDFGSSVEGRYGSIYSPGDKAAVLTRSAEAPAEVRQKITGLIPGKKYTLFYMVADYDDFLNKVNRPRRHPLTCRIEGGTICRRSYWVDDRNKKELFARVNSCKYVFVAKSEEAELVFTNSSAKPGTRLALNYIMVRPYFDR